jgi:hypothetical protein
MIPDTRRVSGTQPGAIRAPARVRPLLLRFAASRARQATPLPLENNDGPTDERAFPQAI